MKVQLKHTATGLIKEAPVGFSWTALFFGFWVPLLRGDWAWCLLYILFSALSAGIFLIVFPFIYNRMFLRKQLEKGYQPANEMARASLIAHKIIASG